MNKVGEHITLDFLGVHEDHHDFNQSNSIVKSRHASCIILKTESGVASVFPFR